MYTRDTIAIVFIAVGLFFSLLTPAIRHKRAWWAMLAVGVLLLLAGVVISLLPQSAFEKKATVPAAPPAQTAPLLKSILKKPEEEGTVLAQVSGDVSPSPTSVTWSDDDREDQALETVVEFEGEESPLSVAPSTKKARKQKAHVPKPVPAVPRRRQLADVVPGYAPSFDTTAVPMGETFSPAPLPPSAGPVFYKPPYKYRTVNQIAEERAEFMSRPDTPELDRHRRVGQLREYGLAIPITAQKDGIMVPLTNPTGTPCAPIE